MKKIHSFIYKEPFKQFIKTNITNLLKVKENRYWSQDYARFCDSLDSERD